MQKIWVKIDEENFDKIKTSDRGFLLREYYPDFHEKFSKEGEIGSFLHIRLIKDW
jgi:hypothetical protein